MPLTLIPIIIRCDDGMTYNPNPPIGYEVHGLPGRSAMIHRVGHVWQIRQWGHGFRNRDWPDFDSWEDALAALEADVAGSQLSVARHDHGARDELQRNSA